MSHPMLEFALPLPIAQSSRRMAQEFANQQPTPTKAEQVRQNTLAVLTVNDYLQLMDIPTDLRVGDSWNPVMRLCADVADLEIVGLGRLECRPVSPDATTCLVPPETWEDRIGYVVVELDEATHAAQVLGFVPAVQQEELPLSELRSPEDLLDHLDTLKPQQRVAAARSTANLEQGLVNLGQWLQGVFEAGWQAVEEVINPTQMNPAYAFRNRGTYRGAEQRARLIDLSPQLAQPIALTVDVRSISPESTTVYLQLQPTGNQPLPANLQLAIFNQAGEEILTGTADRLLEVRGESGEQFSLQITLNDTRVVQEFVI